MFDEEPKIIARGTVNAIYKPPFHCLNQEGNKDFLTLSRKSLSPDSNQEPFIKANEIMDGLDPNFLFHSRWAPCKLKDDETTVNVVNMENSGVSLIYSFALPVLDKMIILLELARPLIDILHCAIKGVMRADDVKLGNLVFNPNTKTLILIDQNTRPLLENDSDMDMRQLLETFLQIVAFAQKIISEIYVPPSIQSKLRNKLKIINFQLPEKYTLQETIDICYKSLLTYFDFINDFLINLQNMTNAEKIRYMITPELLNALNEKKEILHDLFHNYISKNYFIEEEQVGQKRKKGGSKRKKRKRKIKKKTFKIYK